MVFAVQCDHDVFSVCCDMTNGSCISLLVFIARVLLVSCDQTFVTLGVIGDFCLVVV